MQEFKDLIDETKAYILQESALFFKSEIQKKTVEEESVKESFFALEPFKESADSSLDEIKKTIGTLFPHLIDKKIRVAVLEKDRDSLFFSHFLLAASFCGLQVECVDEGADITLLDCQTYYNDPSLKAELWDRLCRFR